MSQGCGDHGPDKGNRRAAEGGDKQWMHSALDGGDGVWGGNLPPQ